MKKICAIIILEVIAINSFCITPREVSINNKVNESESATLVEIDDILGISPTQQKALSEIDKILAEAEEENKRYNLFPLFVGVTVCLIIILLCVLGCVFLKIKSLKPIERIQPKITKMKEDMGTFFASFAQLNKLSRSDKKRVAISFALGIIVGASIVYLLTNRYVSYPSYRSCIVRMDRLTGKTETANAYNPEAGWTEVKKSKR